MKMEGQKKKGNLSTMIRYFGVFFPSWILLGIIVRGIKEASKQEELRE